MTAQNSIAEKSFFGRYFLYKLRTNFNYLVFNLIFAFLGMPVMAVCLTYTVGKVNDIVEGRLAGTKRMHLTIWERSLTQILSLWRSYSVRLRSCQ